MKLLTICIPCYNAINYMHKALGSCLLLKDELEVIVIDKNSTDDTYLAALEYQRDYPDTFKVIKNTNNEDDIKLAYQHATGLYFKLLNSYDWLDRASLVRVIETINDVIRVQANLDVIVTDYCYHYGKKPQKVNYHKLLPTDKIFGWHEIKRFKKNQYLLSPALILKTQIVKNIIDHFSMDTSFHMEMLAYAPLPYIRSFCYIDMPLYCFGRDPFRWVKNNSLKSDELLKVARLYYDYFDIYSLRSRKQRNYMIKYLAMVSLVVSILLCKENSEESMQAREDMWNYLKYTNVRLYNDLKGTLYGKLSIVDGQLPNKVISKGYELIAKVYGR